jgi:hypothetical protein
MRFQSVFNDGEKLAGEKLAETKVKYFLFYTQHLF